MSMILVVDSSEDNFKLLKFRANVSGRTGLGSAIAVYSEPNPLVG
jgi:hypothetical protein